MCMQITDASTAGPADGWRRRCSPAQRRRGPRPFCTRVMESRGNPAELMALLSIPYRQACKGHSPSAKHAPSPPSATVFFPVFIFVVTILRTHIGQRLIL